MNDKREPTLADLGLDQPVENSDKLSIERLQRESEYEVASAPRQRQVRQINHGLNVGAMLFSILFPGAGHFMKGKIGEGLGWGAAFLFMCFTAVAFWPAVFAAIFVYFGAIYSAFKADETDLPEL